eukprot:scaffold12376_cov56-Phaeocystis_antarctica.AAC.2
MVGFNLYGELHSSPTTLGPPHLDGGGEAALRLGAFPGGLRVPATQSPADECAMRAAIPATLACGRVGNTHRQRPGPPLCTFER